MTNRPQQGKRLTLTQPLAQPLAEPTNDLAVFIGRYEPFHNGHLFVIRQALAHARYVMVSIGSTNEARRPDHLPFTGIERERMIRASLTPEENARVIVKKAEDYGNMTLWTESIQALAMEASNEVGLKNPSITLIGHSKDKSSFYLQAFPQWDAIEVPQYVPAIPKRESATHMREAYLNADRAIVEAFLEEAPHFLPNGTIEFLHEFRGSEPYETMVAEWQFMKDYLAPYNAVVEIGGKKVQLFPPKFVTVDNVVIQGGYVLLIQRKSMPGADLWALPGGHLDDGENIQQASLRELHEETRLKVPESVLVGSIVGEPKVFDNPFRSMRKRTITHATLYHLEPKVPTRPDGRPETDPGKIKAALELPKVRAKSDAKQAVWKSLAEVRQMRSQMFEDHYQIIETMKARIPPQQ